jgi:hypothetical protein
MKEVKEVVIGLAAIKKAVAAQLSDGFQADDIIKAFLAIMADEAMKKAVVDAFVGSDKIPAEAKQLLEDIKKDWLATLLVELPELKEIMTALKA